MPCNSIFHYHTPTDVTTPLYKESEESFKDLIKLCTNINIYTYDDCTASCKKYYDFIKSVPPGREQSLAITSLQQFRMMWNDCKCGSIYFDERSLIEQSRLVRMWTNAAIAFGHCNGVH
jgi:hypothetical protein